MKEMLAKTKKTLAHGMSNQSGQSALIMVLILLVLGALILGPLLGFMGTGLKAGQMHEEVTLGLYAADSGVDEAVFWLPELQQNDGSAGPYTNWTRNTTYEMNDRDVDVTVEDVGNQTYKITSTATSAEGGNTTIESYVSITKMDFSELLLNAISSDGDVTIKGTVSGNITLPPDGDLWPADYDPENGEVQREQLGWPTAEELSAFYWQDVEGLTFPDDYIDIDGAPTSIGPLYRDGSLDVYNGVNIAANATLNGTVYVTDDLTIGGTNHDFTLGLNGQTIYCEGAIAVGGKCTIAGSGCIIAVGDIFFEPNILAGSENEFVFILSLNGATTLQPTGDFYGSLAGNVTVDLKPGASLTWTDPSDKDLDFPDGDVVTGVSIFSWQIED